MKIIDMKARNSINKAAETLLNGGVVIFPTDTVYGIGCAFKKPAVRRLYKIKNRPLTQPTAILLTSELFYIFHSSEKSRRWERLEKEIKDGFLGGKITIIFPPKMFNKNALNFPKMILSDISNISDISADGKIGVRLPKYPWLKKLIDKVGPIAASSANKKGEMPPKSFAEINPALLNQVDLVVKTDQTTINQPSRIYDLMNQKYLR